MIFGQILKKIKPKTEIIMPKSKTTKNDSTESKMSLATKEYKRLIKKDGIKRKDIIKEFIDKCELTPAGAATYYNTIKKKLENFS